MSEQETQAHQQQPYDNTLKLLFEDQANEVIRILLGGAEYIQELSQEVLKPPLRADRVYLIRQEEEIGVAHFEMETSPKNDIEARMLEYFGILYRKYSRPIIPIVICPFRVSKVPEPPLRISSQGEVILVMHYRVISLWKYKAQNYLDQHNAAIYALLPTMEGANYERLSQALDEMKAYYVGQDRRFATHLLLFSTFLERSDTIAPDDKRRVLKKMEEFPSFLDANPFVQRRRAEGLAEGRAEGLAEGRAEGLQAALITVIEGRFPPLVELAQRKITHVKTPETLNVLLKSILTAPNEDTARWLLDSIAA